MKVDWGQSGLQLAVCSAVVLPAARRHTNTNSLKQSSHCEGQRADNVLLLLFFNNDTSFFIETLIFTAETARGSDPWFWFVPVSVFQWWKKDSLKRAPRNITWLWNSVDVTATLQSNFIHTETLKLFKVLHWETAAETSDQQLQEKRFKDQNK